MSIYLSPYGVVQVPEALSQMVVVFCPSAVVVQVFSPLEVAQGGGDGACDTAILNTFRSNSKSSLLSFSLGYRQSFNSENPQFV